MTHLLKPSSPILGILLLLCSYSLSAKNVVLVVADDLGLQLGSYGDTVTQTPAMDRLAQEGLRFDNAYCTTPSCSASRSVILTGRHNHATGHYGHSHAWFHFSTYSTIRSLPNLLREAGYRTAHIGKYHLAPESVYRFDNYLSEETPGGFSSNRNTVAMANSVAGWIDQNPDKPFFVYFCPYDPHHGPPKQRKKDPFSNANHRKNPYSPTRRVQFAPDEMEPPSWLEDTPRKRFEFSEYYQAVNRVDQGVERLVEILKERGLYEDTLLIVTSDNGPPFPGAKTTLYEPGVNLPLIIRAPGMTRRGDVSQAMTTFVDFVPTILDYCGVRPPDGPPPVPLAVGRDGNLPRKVPFTTHGRSLMPILDREPTSGWDEAFLSHSFHQTDWYNPMRALRKGKYKYIFNLNHLQPQPFVIKFFDEKAADANGGVSDQILGGKPVQTYIRRSRHELFDLEKDPMELNNLAEKPEYQNILKQMQARMQELQKSTSDPWANAWGPERKMKALETMSRKTP
jgi:N-sulfoglucosamine sulfohydrolase